MLGHPGIYVERPVKLSVKLNCLVTPNRMPIVMHQNRELLRVRFKISEVWGANAENPNDEIEAEIYSHWLEAV